jgi:hypothetical protein
MRKIQRKYIFNQCLDTLMKHLHKLRQLSPGILLKILIHLRCHIIHSEECSIRISKHLKVFQKPRLSPWFSTHFSVFGSSEETPPPPPLVYDILHLKLAHNSWSINSKEIDLLQYLSRNRKKITVFSLRELSRNVNDTRSASDLSDHWACTCTQLQWRVSYRD